MKQALLGVVLGGLILAVTGCGGGGGSNGGGGGSDETVITLADSATISSTTSDTQTVGVGYTHSTSTQSSDIITMQVTSVQLNPSTRILTVNCRWKANNMSGAAQINKISDKDTKTFYIRDSNNTSKTYAHTWGTGAAYTDTVLSKVAVTGTYTFEALDSSTTKFHFYDSTYKKSSGDITIK